MSRLQEQYKNEIIPKLKKELGIENTMAVPNIEKITINMGLGSALGDKKVLESALEELGLIYHSWFSLTIWTSCYSYSMSWSISFTG